MTDVIKRLARIWCLAGWHRYVFDHREPLTWHYWTRYDRCVRCGDMTARGERV